jgi:hypothetical protein
MKAIDEIVGQNCNLAFVHCNGGQRLTKDGGVNRIVGQG